MEHRYIRVKDVEKLIDRDRNTILRWEREGKVPHPQKDSRGWRFYTEKDVEIIKRFMKKQKKQKMEFYKKQRPQCHPVNRSYGARE